jgi:hypothetical protein
LLGLRDSPVEVASVPSMTPIKPQKDHPFGIIGDILLFITIGLVIVYVSVELFGVLLDFVTNPVQYRILVFGLCCYVVGWYLGVMSWLAPHSFFAKWVNTSFGKSIRQMLSWIGLGVWFAGVLFFLIRHK